MLGRRSLMREDPGRRRLVHTNATPPPKKGEPTQSPTCLECDDGPGPSATPSLAPSTSNAPSSSMMPSSFPSDSFFPSENPSDSSMPSESFAPTASWAPSSKNGEHDKDVKAAVAFSVVKVPSDPPSNASSAWPSLSAAPSSSPSFSGIPSESFVPSCYHSKGINEKGRRYLSAPQNHPDRSPDDPQGALVNSSDEENPSLHYLCEGDDDDDNDESGDTDTWQPAPPSEAETPVSGGPSNTMSCAVSVVVVSVGAVIFA